MEQNAFGLKIARAREGRGLSQTALAEAVGISRPYLSQIEGGTRVPAEKVAMKLMAALGLSWDEFLTEHLANQLPPEQLQALGHLMRGFDTMQSALTPEHIEQLTEALGPIEQLDASLRVLQGQAMPPGPEGWLELNKEDRKLVQRLINRLRNRG